MDDTMRSTEMARARVIDSDGITVHTSDDGQTVYGYSVECQVTSGKFVGCTAVAVVTCGIGEEIPRLPQPKQTLLLAFLDGTPDGDVLVVGTVPGGLERPIPRAAAGIAVDDGAGLRSTQVNAPPKGVGIRNYVRGAPYVIRLKGTQDGFAGELYIETDDQADSPDGQNGSYIRIVKDPSTGKFAIKLRDASGASVTCIDGAVLLSSPSGANQIQISDDGIAVTCTSFSVQSSQTIFLNAGSIGLNVPLAAAAGVMVPGGLFSAIHGVSGVAGVPSVSVFIGA